MCWDCLSILCYYVRLPTEFPVYHFSRQRKNNVKASTTQCWKLSTCSTSCPLTASLAQVKIGWVGEQKYRSLRPQSLTETEHQVRCKCFRGHFSFRGKFNMKAENDDFQKISPFPEADFQVPCSHWKLTCHQKNTVVVGRCFFLKRPFSGTWHVLFFFLGGGGGTYWVHGPLVTPNNQERKAWILTTMGDVPVILLMQNLYRQQFEAQKN